MDPGKEKARSPAKGIEQVQNDTSCLSRQAFELLGYQLRAVDYLSKHRAALVVSPAGSGKTLIGAGALDRVLHLRPRGRKVRAAWMCNTIEQKQQAATAIAAFPRLAESMEIDIFCPAGVPDVRGWDVMIVDECHHSTAPTWREIIESHQGAIWGLTATPFNGDPERDALLRKLFRGNTYTVHRHEVAARCVPALVHLLSDTDAGLKSKIDAEIEKQINIRRRFSKQSEEEMRRQIAARVAVDLGVIANKARNAAVVRCALLHREESTLVLVPTILHGEALQSRIPGSAMAFSKMGQKKRRDTINAFRAGELKTLFATSILDEGFDGPCASVLVLAAAGRSAGRTEQRVGRVIRAHPGKESATVYDFSDTQHGLLTSQSRARQAVYRRLGYKILQPSSAFASL